MRTNRFAVAYVALSAVVLSPIACGEPETHPIPLPASVPLDASFGGDWSADVSITVPGHQPVEYVVNLLLLVSGDALTVAGLCPSDGKLFVAHSTSAREAAWTGEVRCGVYRPSCPGAQLVVTAATISLTGNAVTGNVVGRLESPCDAAPPSVSGTLSAIRSTTAPTSR